MKKSKKNNRNSNRKSKNSKNAANRKILKVQVQNEELKEKNVLLNKLEIELEHKDQLKETKDGKEKKMEALNINLQKALEAIDSLTSKVESLNEKNLSLENKLLNQNVAHKAEVDKINKMHTAKSNLLIKN